jgi:hypothetical protein
VGGGVALRSALTHDEPAVSVVVVPVPDAAVIVSDAALATADEAPPPDAAPAPPKHAPASTLVEESQLLERARHALQASDATTALALCERHSRVYVHGELGEERERIAIEALVALGRHDDAAARAKRFDRAFPNSVQSGRIHALVDHR